MALTALERAALLRKVGTPTVSAIGYWRQNWSNCYYHAVAMLLLPYCTITLALQGKKKQTGKHSSYALTRFYLLISLCVRKGNISLHFSFTWNLSLPLLLMRFCSFSWFFPITLGSGITRLLVTFSSRLPPTTASPTEFQFGCDTNTWFSFITFPIQLQIF